MPRSVFGDPGEAFLLEYCHTIVCLCLSSFNLSHLNANFFFDFGVNLQVSRFKYELNFFKLFFKILKKVLDKYMYFVYFCIVQNKQKQNQIMETANEIRQQLESKKAQGNTMIVTRWISRNNPSGLLTVQKQSTHNIDSILNDENRMKNFVDNFNVLEDYHIA